MNFDEFTRQIKERYGVQIEDAVREKIARDFDQERIFIGRSQPSRTKARVLEFGTGVPAGVVALKVGCTVRYVRKVRSLLRGNTSA